MLSLVSSYVSFVIKNIRRTLVTTWNYIYPNLNKIIYHKVDVPGPLLGKDPYGSILVNDHLP